MIMLLQPFVTFISEQDLAYRIFFLVAAYLTESVNHGSVLLRAFAEGWNQELGWEGFSLFTEQSSEPRRLEYPVSSRQLGMHSFTLMEEKAK